MTTRLDEILRVLDASANSITGEWYAEFDCLDAAYLARVLRSGQELRSAVLRYDEQCRDYAASNYDAAVEGEGDE